MSGISEGVVNPRARYPPVAEMTKVLGYVRDKNGIGYSRDIGRSSHFAGRLYYSFGDTFCKNAEGLFVGVSDNTIALIPDPSNPLETEYLDIQEDGVVKSLLRLTDDERSLREVGMRVVLWAFGGIVETSQGVGWIWYQKVLIDSHNLQHYQGTGLARVSVGGADGQLSAFRCDDLIFEPGEPRIGTFSSLVEGDFVYLWGDHGGGVILARVSKFSPTSRNAYRYWNGQNYTKDWREAIHVLKRMQHGSFFKSKLFGSERGWVFVGCTSYADSVVMLGAEANLEGPWTLTPMFQAPGINQPNQFRYCMYGHSWGLDADKGGLLVTWSEHWPGGVIGAKIQLAMDPKTYWKKIPIGGYPRNQICPQVMLRNINSIIEEIRDSIVPWTEDPHKLDPKCDARITIEGQDNKKTPRGYNGCLPLSVCIEATSEKVVNETAESLCLLLTLDGKLKENEDKRRKRVSGSTLGRAVSMIFRRQSV